MLWRSLCLLLREKVIVIDDDSELLRRCLEALLLLIEVWLLSLRLPELPSARAPASSAEGSPTSATTVILLLVAAAVLTSLKPASASSSPAWPLLSATCALATFFDHIVQAHGEPSRHTTGLLRHSWEPAVQRCSRSLEIWLKASPCFL